MTCQTCKYWFTGSNTEGQGVCNKITPKYGDEEADKCSEQAFIYLSTWEDGPKLFSKREVSCSLFTRKTFGCELHEEKTNG